MVEKIAKKYLRDYDYKRTEVTFRITKKEYDWLQTGDNDIEFSCYVNDIISDIDYEKSGRGYLCTVTTET